MNEYLVKVDEAGEIVERLVEAPTAAAARDQTEEESDGDIVAVKLVRVLGFSCRQRGT